MSPPHVFFPAFFSFGEATNFMIQIRASIQWWKRTELIFRNVFPCDSSSNNYAYFAFAAASFAFAAACFAFAASFLKVGSFPRVPSDWLLLLCG